MDSRKVKIQGRSFMYMIFGLLLGLVIGHYYGDTSSKMLGCCLIGFTLDEIVFRNQLRQKYIAENKEAAISE